MKLAYFQGIAITISSSLVLVVNPVVAQITPDETLPINSQVRRLQDNIITIEGGTEAGGNLFHSFKDFSVPRDSTAYFDNATNIQNILTRVTGGSASNIDGLIRANDNANLFLINPSGIIFGQNARLDIGGSFLGTTANALQFGDLGNFSATNPEAPSSLLTINPNALLFNQVVTAPIQNNSIAGAGTNPAGFNVFGLRVPDGKSLLLVGGNINMNAGWLNAYGGRVELGGLAAQGQVNLGVNGNNLSLVFPDNIIRADISLTNRAKVYVGAGGGGSIAVNARNLDILRGSELSGGIGRGLGTPDSVAGDININVTDKVNIVGFAGRTTGISNTVRRQSRGQAGNVIINTGELLLRDGAQVSVSTYGAGNGGNLRVSADSIKLTGNPNKTQETASKLLATAELEESTGTAGNLNITTRELIIEDAAQVSTGTWGAGNGGEMTVHAREKVQVTGFIPATTSRPELGSNINSVVFETATGNGGDIKIETPRLLVQNRASITANAVGQGKAGNLVINTGDLLVENGAQVSASTFGAGKAGDLTISADSIKLTGNPDKNQETASKLLATAETKESTGAAGNLNITTRELIIEDAAQVSTGTWGAGNGGEMTVHAREKVQVTGFIPATTSRPELGSSLNSVAFRSATGNGGNLKIDTPKLLVQNRASVTANTVSRGNAGNLRIDADKLLIENNGQIAVRGNTTGNAGNLTINSDSISLNNSIITAEALSPNKDPNKPQATITLNSTDLILRRGSQITTNARRQNVIGGNININSGVLAVLEGSNISANSTDFRGGRVKIESEGVFGRQSWYPEILRGKITATGATPELSGTVEINTPNVDPSRGTAELPQYIVNAAALINQNFCARGYASRFIITGRGGIVPSPYDVLESNTTWEDWRLNPTATSHQVGEGQGISSESEKINTTQKPDEIVEAQGWIVNKKGQVELVASVSNVTPRPLQSVPVECLLNSSN